MLSLNTPTGLTYRIALADIPIAMPLPAEGHASVVALTNSADEQAAVLRFTTIASGDSMACLLVNWQRLGATHYGVVAEREDAEEATALGEELALTYGVSFA